jgi:flagellar motor component MotA
MKNYQKILAFIALCLAVIGAGCSIGWLAYLHEWFAFVGAIIVAAFAAPTWYTLLKKLLA